MPQTKRQKAVMTKIKNKHGTFIWNPKSYRISQVVKVKDLTGRHGSQIGTIRSAYSEAIDAKSFARNVNNPYIKTDGTALGMIKKGQLIGRGKNMKVISI